MKEIRYLSLGRRTHHNKRIFSGFSRMKNQYFGDHIDFLNYALLRILSNNGRIRLGVCWMLTPNDGSSDGGKLRYLQHPEIWRKFDPPLFDLLHEKVYQQGARRVQILRHSGLLQDTTYAEAQLPEEPKARRRYFAKVRQRFADRDLIFLDPDNGIEVKSIPFGRKNSGKYIYWYELKSFWNRGHSILIAQHFTRENQNSPESAT